MAVAGVREETVVVILAAGKGTRMGNDQIVKVCFEIDGVPAINRQISVFKKARISRFLLVVGDRAEQVLGAVAAEHPEALYVFQEPQMGTGHAARVAADALKSIGYQGNVLVSTGDKLIEEEAIEALVDGFVKQQADMALLTVPKTRATQGSVGRVFVDNSGQALDIIEVADRRRQAVVDELRRQFEEGRSLPAETLKQTLDRHFPDLKKQRRAVAELADLAEGPGRVDPAAARAGPRHGKVPVEDRRQALHGAADRADLQGPNPSLYLFKAEAFYRAVGMLDNDNAQKGITLPTRCGC